MPVRNRALRGAYRGQRWPGERLGRRIVVVRARHRRYEQCMRVVVPLRGGRQSVLHESALPDVLGQFHRAPLRQ